MDSIGKATQLLTFVMSVNGLSGYASSDLVFFWSDWNSQAYGCVLEGN